MQLPLRTRWTVTRELNFHFLQKAAADTKLVAQCQILKLVKRSVTAEVKIYSKEQLIACATGRYAIPPTK
ncbi:hypothetical protein HR060_05525 [Catenovulum sp. SM1970]|uniref:PaaI family thioesterase n=1 Tax=Marinifaba aquimaris TaxID=2741323 RepID=UPI003CCE342B|nr:hypothetical protein [Marinifaba aquimaris]